MMNISSLTSSAAALQNLPASAAVQGISDPDGDGESHRAGAAHGHHGHHGGGHGGMMQGLQQALSALGLATVPATSAASSSGTASGSAPPSTSVTDASGTASTSPAGATNNMSTDPVRRDERQFLHALFGAMRDAQSASGTGPSNAGSGMEQKLADVIGQVTSGNAPQALQDAFNRLATDLGANSGGGANAGTANGATLAALLQKMQSNMAQSGTASATGNFVNQIG